MNDLIGRRDFLRISAGTSAALALEAVPFTHARGTSSEGVRQLRQQLETVRDQLVAARTRG